MYHQYPSMEYQHLPRVTYTTMEKGENMNDALEKVSGDVVTEVSKLENKRRKQNKYSKDSYARQCGRFGPAFLQHRADIVNKSRNKARHVRTLNHDEAKQWQLEIHAGKIEMYVDVKIEKDRAILNDLLQSSLMEKSPTESSVLPSGRPLREAAAKTLLPSFHGYETNLDDLLYVKWTKEFGWGVYAAKRIEGSTKLTFYNGVAMNKEEMLAQETNDKIFQPDPDVEWYINGDINDMEQFDHNEVITGDEIKRIPNIAALMNHACVCESTAIVVVNFYTLCIIYLASLHD